jgi:hypothetical protein
MADDDAGRSEWLVAPPEAGEIRLVVELGEGAELSPAAADALENLVATIEDAEVSGFMMAPTFNIGLMGNIRLNSTCNKLSCNKHDCSGTFVCDTYKAEGFM